MTVNAAPFAYISNSNSANVSVIDTATNTVVATVPVAGLFAVQVLKADNLSEEACRGLMVCFHYMGRKTDDLYKSLIRQSADYTDYSGVSNSISQSKVKFSGQAPF